MSPEAARTRDIAQGQRIDAILRAALTLFTEQGFQAARIADVARAAGVAKGTVYLYFDSKEALLKALIASHTAPPLEHVSALIENHEGSAEELLRKAIAMLRSEVLETDRRLVIRLVLTEGHRFPDIAAYYHDRVLRRGMAFMSAIVRRGVDRGEFHHDAPARFPQLVLAPLLLAVLWQELFAEHATLDTAAMLDAHVELLLLGMKAEKT